jgi:hypothetical protein
MDRTNFIRHEMVSHFSGNHQPSGLGSNITIPKNTGLGYHDSDCLRLRHSPTSSPRLFVAGNSAQISEGSAYTGAKRFVGKKVARENRLEVAGHRGRL